MKKNTAIAASIIGALSLVLSFSTEAKSTKDFVHTASIANQFEIDSSKLALDKSENTDVKNFAQRMVDDHTKTADKLQATLQSSKSGVRPPAGLDSKHQKMIEQLKNTSGKDFDHQYIKMQTKAHKEAVSLFSDYAKHGSDPSIREFATQTLPTLKGHLNQVEKLKTAR